MSLPIPSRSILIAVLASFALGGCKVKFDPKDVRASAGAPSSAVVEELRIPYDASLPKWVIKVEMPTFPSWTDEISRNDRIKGKGDANVPALGSNGKGSAKFDLTGNYTWVRQFYQYDKFTQMVSAQFVSALAGVENFSVVDPASSAQIAVGQNERGPFVARAQVTMAESRVVTDKEKTRAIVFMADEEVIEGVAGLDVQLIDTRSGRVVTSFPMEGTYISKRKRAGGGLIIPVYEVERSARSLIENATRVALQNSAKRMFEILSAQR